MSQVELEIIEHLQKGCSLKETGDILRLSGTALKVYRYSIAGKLELKNTVALNDYISNSQLELYERYAM